MNVITATRSLFGMLIVACPVNQAVDSYDNSHLNPEFSAVPLPSNK